MDETLTTSSGTCVRANQLQITENELWLLSYYRESELAGALLMGRLARQTDDDELRVRFTEHCAEEARHAWAWTETILKVGGTPQAVSEWPGTHPEVAATLRLLIADEAGHISWVKERLDAIAAVEGEHTVEEMLERFRRIDDQVYTELSAYAQRFEEIVCPAAKESPSSEQRLLRVAAESLGCEPSQMALDDPLAELGVDSLDVVVLMMAVEEEFQVEFTKEDQKKMISLRDVAHRIERIGQSGR